MKILCGCRERSFLSFLRRSWTPRIKKKKRHFVTSERLRFTGQNLSLAFLQFCLAQSLAPHLTRSLFDITHVKTTWDTPGAWNVRPLYQTVLRVPDYSKSVGVKKQHTSPYTSTDWLPTRTIALLDLHSWLTLSSDSLLCHCWHTKTLDCSNILSSCWSNRIHASLTRVRPN